MKRGFTIVELAVVIGVIAILAAVMIIGYGSWRQNVARSEVQNDLQAAAGAMESARNFGEGYPTSLPSDFSASDGVTLTYSRGDTKSFCINGVSKKLSNVTYFYDTLTGKSPQTGSCGAIVTNLVRNPRPDSGTYYVASSTGVATVSFPTVSGETVARSTRTATGTGAYALYIERSTGGVATATTGATYTMLYSIRSNVSTSVISQVGYGSATASIGALNQTVNLSPNALVTVRHTFTLPSGYDGQFIYPKVYWASGVEGNYIEVSKMMMVSGTYSRSFADGTSNGWTWSGTPNASRSTGPAPQ